MVLETRTRNDAFSDFLEQILSSYRLRVENVAQLMKEVLSLLVEYISAEADGDRGNRNLASSRAQISSSQLAVESPLRVKVRLPCSNHPMSGAIRASKRCHCDPAVRNIK
ncbi:MAG: hypothetical protein RDV48_17280 [Candidatus Eremiobacteraeota bacterium]|nr:hypothetical protein [Candidatus Eremiobacteraeota bacterium]